MAATTQARGRAQKSPARGTGLGAEAKSLVGEASELVDHTLKFKSTWEQRLHDAATEHPYLSLGSASAAGFVVGGGLSFLVTRRLWLVGARLAVLHAPMCGRVAVHTATRGEIRVCLCERTWYTPN